MFDIKQSVHIRIEFWQRLYPSIVVVASFAHRWSVPILFFRTCVHIALCSLWIAYLCLTFRICYLCRLHSACWSSISPRSRSVSNEKACYTLLCVFNNKFSFFVFPFYHPLCKLHSHFNCMRMARDEHEDTEYIGFRLFVRKCSTFQSKVFSHPCSKSKSSNNTKYMPFIAMQWHRTISNAMARKFHRCTRRSDFN